MSTEPAGEAFEGLKDELLRLLLEEEGIAAVPAPAIVRRPEAEPAPPSYAQQGLWVLDRVEGSSTSYHIALGVRLRGALSRDALGAALDAVVRRHEPLRTVFRGRDGRAMPAVLDAREIELEQVDLRTLTLRRREDELRRRAEAIALRPFDLARDLPARAALFACGKDFHVLLLVFHHIAVDRRSLEILVRELCAGYDAETGGADAKPPPLPIRYADYAAWQRGPANRRRLEAGLDYWERRLAGAPSLVDLPTDRHRRTARERRGGVERVRIDPAVAEDLRRLGASCGATPFMTLLAAFAVLLARSTGQEDISVGSPAENRTAPETEGLIGLFANPIVLRCQVAGDPSFVELLAAQRDRWIADLEHADTPFEAIVERVRPPRVPGQSPLFQVMFQLEPASPFSARAAGLGVSVDRFELPVAVADLTLELQEGPDGMTGRLEYRADLFEPETVRSIGRRYACLLAGIAAAPHAPISQLPLMDEGEAMGLVARCDATATAAPPATIVELFGRVAADRPDAPALRTEGETVSYRELAARARAITGRILALGIGPEDRVAVALPRCPDLIAALLGIMGAGAAFVPLDPDHPAARLVFLLEDSRAALLITSRAIAARIPAGPPRLLLDGDPCEAGPPCPRPDVSAASAAYVMYTSGSTGAPKGVVGTHGAAVNRCRWMWEAFPFEPGEVCCHKTTITFVDSVWEIFGPLLAGVPAVILDAETASDPRLLAAALARHRVTRLVLVPSLLREILDGAGPAPPLPSLKLMIASGEPLPPGLAARFRAASAGCRLLNLYGSTEVAGDATCHEVGDGDRSTVPIGRPISGLAVRLLDQHQKVVPVGVAGEICVAGAGLARGYHGRGALTAERWVPDPYGPPASRMYRTGDLGRSRADGTIEFLGRADRQVKINGVRIEPAEVQEALAGCPGVRDSVVIARPNHKGELQLVAYVVGRPDTAAATMLRPLRDKLPASLVPAAFVALDRLPLNPNGKVDLAALPEPAGSPENEQSRRPLTAVEQALAETWGEALGREDVHALSNFFDLGGHSLAAIRAVARANEAYACAVPVAALFDAPTLEEFARVVEDARGRGDPAPPAATLRNGRIPASAAQRRAWFLEHLEGQSAIDNLAVAFRLRGPLDADALDLSLRVIVRRHEALRTRLQERDGELVQVINLGESFAPARPDFSGSATVEDEARRLFAVEARRPFTLDAEPPLRVALARLAEDDHVLAVVLHHAASDGWSGTLFTRELNLLYREATGGAPANLASARPYAEYALWQEHYRASGRMADQIEVYRRELAGAPPVLELPTDHRRPEVPSRRAGREPLHLDAALAEGLRDVGRSSDATSFMTLLAAFGLLLHRYSGQAQLIVGTPVAGRTQPEFLGMIGSFANNLVVRLDVEADETFGSLLARVRRRVIAAFDLQDVPFDALVEALRPARDPRWFPVFQAMFVLRDTRPWLPELPGVAVERIDLANPATRFDLTLVLDESEGGFSGHIEYARDLFEPVTIRRMAANFATLLRAIAADRERPVARLDLVSCAEEAELLVCATSGEAVETSPPRLDRLIARQAAATPDAVAVEVGAGRLTYSGLIHRSHRLAQHLRSTGVGPGEMVVIFLDRSPDLIVSIIAVFEAGAAYVPLDPAYPAERVRQIVADSRARFAIVNDASPAAAWPGVTTIHLDLEARAIERRSPEAPTGGSDGDAPAALIYTSGSSGTPKGVVIAHHALVQTAVSLAGHLALRPGDRVLQVATIGFDMATGDVATSLIAGATLCLAARADLLPGPPLLRSLRRTCATHVTLPASLLAGTPTGPLPDLKVILVGGEPCPPETVRTWSAGRRLLNGYGPTEATVVVTLAEYRGEVPLPIGRPIAGARVLVLDECQRPVPFGVAGELYIGGGLAIGYFGKPAETAARFIADPAPGGAGGRLYRTGDRGRLRYDGQLEFLGRLDRQVKIRGVRVEPGEVEAVLAAQAGVAQALVGVRKDGRGDTALLGWILPRPGEPPSLPALREVARAILPPSLVPDELIAIDSVPLTTHGKIDWEALPSGGGPAGPAPAAEPAGDLERLVADAWCEALGRVSVGRDENFFDAGGHSLRLVRVHTRLEATLARVIPIVDLFRFPTIRALAQHLGAVPEAAPSPSLATAAAGYEPIAIVGMACRYPGAPDIDAFARLIAEGTEAITRFSVDEVIAAGVAPELARHPDYVRAGGVVPDIDLFDAPFFGFSPREAEELDPQHRVFLECAWQALEDAGYAAGRDAGPVGVFAGCGMNTYLHGHLFAGAPPRDASGFGAMIGNDKDFLPTLVSYRLDLKGPSVAVQTACSTSLVAVDLACQALHAGRCRTGLAGGVSFALPQTTGYRFKPGMILSPDGTCRPFDAAARGTVPSGGAGVVVLKRLIDAQADGDRVLAVIRGSATNNDGAAKVGFTAPSVEGQAAVIAAALAAAGIDGATIGYVEAHGTGTELGDPIELAALARALAPGRASRCTIGSVKANIGHADAAAGVAGLIKAVLCLRRGTLPPSPHFSTPNLRADAAGGTFDVNTRLQPWPEGMLPRRSGVSSFGIGGTNAHVVLEEAPPPEPRPTSGEEVHVFPLSAQSAAAADAAVAALHRCLGERSDLEAGDVAFTLQRGRVAFAHRRAVVAPTVGGAAARLSGSSTILEGIVGAAQPRVAFALPARRGGSLDVAAFYDQDPVFRGAFDACASLFEARIGAVVRPGATPDDPGTSPWPAEAAFTASYALAQLWFSWGVRPEVIAGAGCGAYLAACLAGVFPIDDAVALLVRRGLPRVTHPFRAALSAPKIPLFSLATGSWVAGEDAADPSSWCGPLLPDRAEDGLDALERDPGLVLLDLTAANPEACAAALARLWVAGAEIDWGAVQKGKRRRRVPLPPTPMDRTRHWREARRPRPSPEEPSHDDKKRDDPEDWFYLPSWRQTPRPVRAEGWGWADLPWILLPDRSGLAADIADDLRRRGARVVSVVAGTAFTSSDPDRFTINPARAADWAELVADLCRRGLVPARLVDLWGVGDGSDEADVADDLDRGLHPLLALAAALGRAGIIDPVSIALITTGAVDVTGTEALRPGIAAALGAVKVIPLEQNHLRCRCIDVSPTGPGTSERHLLVDQILDELASAADEVTVAYRGAHRWAPDVQPVRLPDPADRPDRLRRGGVYLITGGLGGAGLAVAGDLADKLAAKLVLVARTPLPPRLSWDAILGAGGEDTTKLRAILAMEAAGREVMTAAADVSDLAAMGRVVSEARDRFGRIDGVIHAAGVADFAGIVANRSREQTEAVLAAKVTGTLVIDRLFREAEPDFLVLFSTLGSILHHTKFGQVGYAAANEFLDAYAPARTARGGPFTVAINWDDWAGAGMSHAAARRGGAAGVDAGTALAPHEGGAVLRRVLNGPYARLAVSVRPLEALIRRDATAIEDFLRTHTPLPQARPAGAGPFAAPATPTEAVLAALWQDCLGVETVGAQDDFFDLGGHSLLATEVLAGIRSQCGVELPMEAIFDETTIRSLAALIDRKRDAGAAEEFEL